MNLVICMGVGDEGQTSCKVQQDSIILQLLFVSMLEIAMLIILSKCVSIKRLETTFYDS